MMCMVANLTYILLSSDGANTNNNDECAGVTVADGSSARAPENEYVALLNHGRTNELRSSSTRHFGARGWERRSDDGELGSARTKKRISSRVAVARDSHCKGVTAYWLSVSAFSFQPPVPGRQSSSVKNNDTKIALVVNYNITKTTRREEFIANIIGNISWKLCKLLSLHHSFKTLHLVLPT
eukprot:scaffold2759_cov57-Cyclotella_meneghiniana.AAC.2